MDIGTAKGLSKRNRLPIGLTCMILGKHEKIEKERLNYFHERKSFSIPIEVYIGCMENYYYRMKETAIIPLALEKWDEDPPD